MPKNNEDFKMLPLEVVENFEEGDSILIKAESKNDKEIIESFSSLEGAKNFILTDARYKLESLNIELVKNKIED